MVEFKFEEDIPRELEKGNFSKAIMMCHDFVQLALYNLLSSAMLYLGAYKEAFKYTNFLNPHTLNKRSINKAYQLGLLSDSEKESLIKIKEYRDKKVAHNSLFFDKQVLTGEIKIEEVLEIIKISKQLIQSLMKKINSISGEVLNDTKRVLNGEDINSILKEHTHQKLLNILANLR